MSKVGGQTPRPASEEDYRYGWRDTTVTDPDGEERIVRRALTEEEILHPQEGDFIVQTHWHLVFLINLVLAIEQRLLSLPGVRYRADHLVNWGKPKLGDHA